MTAKDKSKLKISLDAKIRDLKILLNTLTELGETGISGQMDGWKFTFEKLEIKPELDKNIN